MEYYSVIRNDKYPPFASTWMELEGIMLSEVSQFSRHSYLNVSLSDASSGKHFLISSNLK